MPHSFKEKCILSSLVILAVVSLNYFVRVFAAATAGTPLDAAGLLKLGIGLLVVLVVLEIVFKTWLAARSPEEAAEGDDERDRLFSARAGRNGGVMLAGASFVIVVHVLGNSLLGREAWMSPVLIANFILLGLVLAQVTEYVSQLIYYRRGG